MEKIAFDLETTGVDLANDRIVEIGFIIYDEDLNVKVERTTLINPEMRIPKEATEIHGITDDMVKNAPKFKDIAKKLSLLFKNKEIIGYNILGFDLPLLLAEFERVGEEANFSDKIVDVYKVESNLFPRTLSAIYKKYVDEELDNAHDALADTRATIEIMKNHIGLANNLGKTLYALSESENLLDYGAKFAYDNEGYIVFNFGKHKGKRLMDEVDYCKWMLKSDFSTQVKNIIKEEINE